MLPASCRMLDKVHFDPLRTKNTIDEQAFEQIVSRFDNSYRIPKADMEYLFMTTMKLLQKDIQIL